MYALPDAIEEYLRDNPAKPYLSCEYMHSMGNSVGGLQLYTALERYPAYGGGFIWDLVDQALYHEAVSSSPTAATLVTVPATGSSPATASSSLTALRNPRRRPSRLSTLR